MGKTLDCKRWASLLSAVNGGGRGAGIAHHEQSLISMIALFILYSLSIADAH